VLDQGPDRLWILTEKQSSCGGPLEYSGPGGGDLRDTQGCTPLLSQVGDGSPRGGVCGAETDRDGWSSDLWSLNQKT
jgi:hypothetical protein